MGDPDGESIKRLLITHPSVLGAPAAQMQRRLTQLSDLVERHSQDHPTSSAAASSEQCRQWALQMVRSFPILLRLDFSRNVEATFDFLLEREIAVLEEVSRVTFTYSCVLDCNLFKLVLVLSQHVMLISSG